MDSHSFEFNGDKYKVERFGDRGVVFPACPTTYVRDSIGAACAEILRLAQERESLRQALRVTEEERDSFKRSAEWDSEQRDLANEALRLAEEALRQSKEEAALLRRQRDYAQQQWEAADASCDKVAKLLREMTDERDALSVTVEEGREIGFEITTALAVLAGESLVPCGDGTCPGHFGPKTTEAFESALAVWRALRDGNRAAVKRIADMEAELRFSVANEARLSELCEDREMLGDLLVQLGLAAHEKGEDPRSVLNRLLRLRRTNEETEGARLVLLADLRREKERADRAEKTGRQYCLELAEKAEEIRELREKLSAERIDKALRWTPAAARRAAKILAMLDSEEPPVGISEAMRQRGVDETRPEAVWRWLREQARARKAR